MAFVRLWGPIPRVPCGPTSLGTGPRGCRSMSSSLGPKGSLRALLNTSGSSFVVRSRTSWPLTCRWPGGQPRLSPMCTPTP
eukprot:4873086-Lingulodinium_polyedra.AAC.1